MRLLFSCKYAPYAASHNASLSYDSSPLSIGKVPKKPVQFLAPDIYHLLNMSTIPQKFLGN
jgi:hypothetical protein